MIETLPPELDDFGSDLEQAVARDLRRLRRWRRVRASAIAAAAIAIASVVGVLSLSGGVRRPLDVPSAAAAALEPQRGWILHVVSVGWAWRDESWQLTAPPFTDRVIEHSRFAPRAEADSSGDIERLYDSARNTVYVFHLPRPPKFTLDRLRSHGNACSERFRWQAPDGAWHAARVDCASIKLGLTHGMQAEGPDDTTVTFHFRDADGEQRTVRVATKPRAQIPRPQSADDPRARILSMLRSGRARVQGRTRVAGQEAIDIRLPDGQIYVVNARTYAPIQLETGAGILRYAVYEMLPATPANRRLLSIEAQHPGARVVDDPDAYRAAEKRLYPHG